MNTEPAAAGQRPRSPGTKQAPEVPGVAAPAGHVLAYPPRTEAFSFSGTNRAALKRELSRVAQLAPALSDPELHDLACHGGRETGHGTVRAGVVASSQDQLARRAREAAALLDGLPQQRLVTVPGIFAADGGTGRVVLLFPGEGSPPAESGMRGTRGQGTYDPRLQPAIIAASLAGLRRLSQLGVAAVAGVGHGVGEITGLVWAGCLSEPDAARLTAQRAALLAAPAAVRTALVSVETDRETAQRVCAGTGLVITAYNGPRSHVLAGPQAAVAELRQRLAERGIPAHRLDSPHGFYSPAMSDRVAPLRSILRELTFRPPSRRLISSVTAAELSPADDIMLNLCRQLMSPVRFAGALDRACAGTDLLVETGPGAVLSRFAAGCSDIPAVSLSTGTTDDVAIAVVAAALFAAGAVGTLAPLFTGRAARAVASVSRKQASVQATPGAPGAGRERPPSAGAPVRADRSAAVRAEHPGRVSPGTATAGTGRHARSGIGRSRDPGQDVAGVRPWVRCFTDELRMAQPPRFPADGGRWRLRTVPGEGIGMTAVRVFPHDPNADTVLVVVASLTEVGAGASLLGAAREAVGTGRLVAIGTQDSLAGFCASLHAEHPALGITAIMAAPGEAGLRAARGYAAAAPGVFRVVRLDETGRATEPAVVPVMLSAEGTFPLGPADVVLVSGLIRRRDLACATALAGRGAALAFLAPPGPEDPQLAACLAGLRAAGVRVSRKRADLTDAAQVAAAVRSLELGMGPVTAVVHAAISGPAERCARLSEQALRRHLVTEERRFGSVLAVVSLERLRLLLTFGSLTARYGAPGGACDGLASEVLAEQARRRTSGLARCQTLHIDWGPCAAAGPSPPETMPVSAGEASRLLVAMLTSPDLPHRVAVHGRVAAGGALATATRPRLPGRFLDTVRVHYPGVELVVDARLSLPSDPYLGDYRVDGLAVLPPSMSLEAMAQAASVLAGTPQRHADVVRMSFPVAVPTGETVIRVCALRTGDTVETVLRCAETGFRVDHASAMFHTSPKRGAVPPDRGRGQPEIALCSQDGAGRQAGDTGRPGPHPREHDADGMPAGGVVDGTDLYGPVLFQEGRFRRVAFLSQVGSRECRALVRGDDDTPWFGAIPRPAGVPLILGNPGLNDAAVQVLQACLPHRRVLVASCDSASFSGDEARGAVRVHAIRRSWHGRDDRGRDGGIWDVTATDSAGQRVMTWAGVAMRDLGPLPRGTGWQPALLAASLEARAAELGIDPFLRASIVCGCRPATVPGQSVRLALPQPRSPGSGQGGSPRLRYWSDTAVGHGPLSGFELTVRAARPVACQWQAVAPYGWYSPPDEELGRLREQILSCLPETAESGTARMSVIGACLAALGREPGAPCAVDNACGSGWIVVRTSGLVAACAVTEIVGVPVPVAVSIAGTAAPVPAELAIPPNRPPREQDGAGPSAQAASRYVTDEAGQASD